MEKKIINYELKDFNYTSDLHVDHYKDKVDLRYIPEWFMKDVNKSDVLIIAGDFSNNNNDTYKILDILSKKWKYILFVDGNHDSYGDKKKRYEKHWRLNRLDKFLENYPNIYRLSSKSGIIEFSNGIKIAGCNLWYDMNSPLVQIDILEMNDRKHVGLPRIYKESENDLKYYNQVIDYVDIFVSHVPVLDQFGPKWGFGYTCYYRNLKLRDNKIYIFGHMHDGQSSRLEEMNIDILTKPIGYVPTKETRFGYFKLKDK